MARGITETDVFSACDALLLAGERPTIERVRQKIGRGSPNTVSPMLDAWFKGLGRRLQDPGAFAAPPNIPEPVNQAAQHFWEVAQAQARGDFDQAVATALTPLQQQLDAANHAAAILRAEGEALARDMDALRGQLADAASRIDAERMARAATSALLERGQAQHDELCGRVVAAEAAVVEAREQARRESAAAHERATGAERRAALEIENERAARGRAEKRADSLERRIEVMQNESQTAAASQLAELVSTRGALELAREQLFEQRALTERECLRANAADSALVDAQLARERAEEQTRGVQELVARVERLIPRGQPKRAAKAAHSAKP